MEQVPTDQLFKPCSFPARKHMDEASGCPKEKMIVFPRTRCALLLIAHSAVAKHNRKGAAKNHATYPIG
jgi:hypothetical protein